MCCGPHSRAGTLTGAPKVRTMEIIEELEGERRGIYGGAVGYFSFNGQMDTCIVIRTIVMIGDTCYMQAAGGVVADSTPTGEYEETANKMRAVLVAIDEAESSSAWSMMTRPPQGREPACKCQRCSRAIALSPARRLCV